MTESDVSAGSAPQQWSRILEWASVCLALYIAFWLELDNPYWAGTSAAIEFERTHERA